MCLLYKCFLRFEVLVVMANEAIACDNIDLWACLKHQLFNMVESQRMTESQKMIESQSQAEIQNQSQNLHESSNPAVLLSTPLQHLIRHLKIPTVKVNSEEHVNGLERVVVHE